MGKNKRDNVWSFYSTFLQMWFALEIAAIRAWKYAFQEYSVEHQKDMLRCGVVEDIEEVCCFYGGLRHEI